MNHPASRPASSERAIAGAVFRRDSGVPMRFGRASSQPGAGTLMCASAVFACAVATVSPARAQTPAEPAAAAAPSREEQAADKFRQGRQLLDQGRFQEACQKFEESLSLASHPGTLLNLGNCYEQPGDLLRALAAFQRALAEAPREPDPDRRQAWTQAARERVEAVSERVPKLTVHPSPTPAVRVLVDGQPLAGLGAPLRLNPGTHRIEATAEGKQPFVQQVMLVAGQKVDVSLPELADIGGPTPSYAESAPPLDEGTSGGSRFGVLPWALMGGGAAAFAAGMVTGLIAKSKADELDDQCSDMRDAAGRRICTDPDLRNTRDSAETLAVVTDVLWIGGLLVAGAGVTLYVLEDDSSEASTNLEAGCFAGGCGLKAFGRF